MAFKYTSEQFEIRATVTETAANTFTQEEIQINLDSLNREILIIMSVDLDTGDPFLVDGTNTAVTASLTKTSQTDTVPISNPSCIAHVVKSCRVSATPGSGVSFAAHYPVLEHTGDYHSILATDNAFIGVEGTGNPSARRADVLIKARRARADADTYAALVTSEAGLN